MRAKTLGILGGLGPAASVYFYHIITSHTKAEKDQDHLNIVLISGADIPDRSEFILGKSDRSPLPLMKEDVLKLASVGAELIAIPCNTAHYFFDELSAVSPVPVLNIVRETVALAKKSGAKKLGILATTGTIAAHAYQEACRDAGLSFEIPDESAQNALMDIIYGDIKKAAAPDIPRFLAIADDLLARGCDAIVLGCTELSVIAESEDLSRYPFIDSRLVLAARSILACGKIPCGFPEIYTYLST